MIESYTTFKEGEYLVFEELNWTDAEKDSVEEATVIINQEMDFQMIIGFGASFTESSAFLFQEVLTEKDREKVMIELFDQGKGIGLNMLRNPIGSSDYARCYYHFAEVRNDWDLEHFSIVHDESSILPLTLLAHNMSSELTVIASPWSAPDWMKTSESMIGGTLKKSCYEVYAQYFVKYIQSYKMAGIDIDYLTVQNEPLFIPENYAGMFMSAEEQAFFIKDFLYPKLRESGITTKILCYDHNWDHPEYPLEVLALAGKSVAGVAWHWYGGNPEAQKFVSEQFPDKEILFTEGSGGEWIAPFEPAFSNLLKTGIEILKNGSQNLILWNIALDECNGPVVPGFGRSTCRGLVTVNQETRKYELTLDYYGLAHFSRFIPKGSRRIQSLYTGTSKIYQVTFLTPENNIVLVLFNDEWIKESIWVEERQRRVKIELIPKSAKTIVFKR